MERKRRNTWILALSLLVLLLLGLLVQRLLFRGEALRAVVEQDGEAVAVLALSEDRELTVEAADGGQNRIEVKDGSVAIVEADCPDKVCVKTGRISEPGGVIACLPHGLIVYVEGEGA